jgi:hypothetical protein
MKKNLWCFLVFFIGSIPLSLAQRVAIQKAHDSPQAAYAAGILEKSLSRQGYALKGGQADYVITVNRMASPGSKMTIFGFTGKR